ncbi:DUF692 domain-containing protein [Halopseudomonas pelagia]|uniref:HvfB family MNIO-type RiPP peptide maturase n=1 Tax=Halopseudomonas pelagia TaxID=553151 RepID=UPI0030D754C3|tara:strand:+ start:2017 stop:2856 length:840 start_codon:yes stop_codon:yes gene_type:complete
MAEDFVQGAGLGLRRALLAELANCASAKLDFLEVAPENWIGLGGRMGRQFRAMTERFPFLCHGLSLNLGGFAPLDMTLVRAVRDFLNLHGIKGYSEHLSACADDGQLYDLMPVAFCEENVWRIAARIRQVEDVLERRLIIENVSAYAALPGDMNEAQFIRAVLTEADCQLLLDVNNVYVNAINFDMDAYSYINAMPGERIAYMHVAGHYDQSDQLKVDTHGAPVIDPVWDLLGHAYRQHGVRPTLLERDFNFPPLDQLLAEVERIRTMQAHARRFSGAA